MIFFYFSLSDFCKAYGPYSSLFHNNVKYTLIHLTFFIHFFTQLGKGGKNRRRGKNENESEKRELVFKEDGQGKFLKKLLTFLFLVWILVFNNKWIKFIILSSYSNVSTLLFLICNLFYLSRICLLNNWLYTMSW